jgi:hypothetical protein
MSASAQVLRTLGNPIATLPPAVKVPLVGWLWVFFNVVVIWLGIVYGYSVLASLLAGGIDGTLFAVIAVSKASTRFQAVVTGLLTGLGMNKLNGDASIVTTATIKVHAFVDWMMGEVIVNGPDNPIHAQVQDAVLRIIWVATFVVVASLVAEWIRAAEMGKSEAAEAPAVETAS